MVTDLYTIKQEAIRKQAENVWLKEQLRPIPTKQVDALVQELNLEVASEIDCTKCANCCKVLEPPVDEDEVKVLAGLKEISTDEFIQTYTSKEPNTQIQFLKCQPCIFLKGTSCGIYEQRPASCADYPHLHQPNFKYRWKSIMANYTLCPIVFNVVERLKEAIRDVKPKTGPA